MKILKIYALNINSLKGKTEIDFEEIFKLSPLFAITGPTGAGKSTILDVITCALYGKTARLKNPSLLISKHCGEGVCEVSFEVKGKIYRSSWMQKKARLKHDGKLQPSKMELAEYDGKIIQTGTKVPKFIEELTGLDFERFTQSMMLSQGDFDAFLKAKQSDRSVLLERITGTKIYALISQSVYEKFSFYKNEIEIIKKTLENIDLLNSDILKQKEESLSKNKKLKKELDKNLNKLMDEINWVKTLLKLKKDYKNLTLGFDEISKIKKDKKDDFLILNLANRALNVAVVFTKKTSLLKTFENDSVSLKSLTKELEDTKIEINKKIELFEFIKIEEKEAEEKFESEFEKLKSRRVIETEKAMLEKNHNELKDNLKADKNILIELEKNLLDIALKQNREKIEIEKSELYLKKNINDKELSQTLDATFENLNKYHKQKQKLELIEIEKIDLAKDNEKNEILLNEMKKNIETLEIESKTCDENYANEERLSQTDEEDELIFQKQIREILEYKKLIDKKTLEENKSLENLKKQTILIEKIRSEKEQIDEYEKHLDTLQSKKTQELLVQKYEEDRKRLKKGEECFLCGSTNHPFSKMQTSLSNTEDLIKEYMDKSSKKQEQLKELERGEIRFKTIVENSQEEISKLDLQLVVFPDFKGVAGLQNRADIANEKISSIKKRREKKVELLKKKESTNIKLKDNIHKFNEKNIADIEKKAKLKQLKESEKIYQENIKTLIKELKSGGIRFDNVSQEVEFEQLKVRSELYVKHRKSLELLSLLKQDLEIEKKECETKMLSLKNKIKTDDEKILLQVKELKDLDIKKISILNVLNLDSYEKEIRDRFSHIKDKVQDASSKLNELKIKNIEKTKQIDTLKIKVSTCEKSILKTTNEFEKLLDQNSFKTIKEFENALLDSEEKDKLSASCKKIEDEFNSINTLKHETNRQLDKHKKVMVCEKPLEELEEKQALYRQEVDLLQVEIGKDEKELEINSKNENRFKGEIKTLKKTEEDFSIWVKLQELIGSSDGNKFAKFAQGITLDQLIHLANRHLKILTSRYSLIRSEDEKQQLEIEVIDAFQGDVNRLVSTLSGGESFIVSLALALGLSELASQKIAIDSLFLDEGFGTLDEDSLETALNALALLQSGGKMVGVISHVEALKQRISTEIKVVPNGDGTSRVIVPRV